MLNIYIFVFEKQNPNINTMFKIIQIQPFEALDSEHRLPIIARCMCGDKELCFTTLTTRKPKKGENRLPYTITCNCEELKEALARIGNGKTVEITLPCLKKKDFSIMEMGQFSDKQTAETIFKGKTENVIPCPTGSGWNYLRVRHPKLDSRGKTIGETIEYYCYNIQGIPTFTMTIGKKVYHLLPEVLEYVIQNGEIPDFVEEARKRGEIAVLPDK